MSTRGKWPHCESKLNKTWAVADLPALFVMLTLRIETRHYTWDPVKRRIPFKKNSIFKLQNGNENIYPRFGEVLTISQRPCD